MTALRLAITRLIACAPVLAALLLLAAYPATLFSAASIGLIAAPTLRLKFTWGYWLFLAALVVTGFCWMSWNLKTLDGSPVDGIWINSLFSISIASMGLGVLFWRFEASHSLRWERISESFTFLGNYSVI